MYVETRYLKGMEEPELTPPPDLNYENPLIAWLYDRIIGPAATRPTPKMRTSSCRHPSSRVPHCSMSAAAEGRR